MAPQYVDIRKVSGKVDFGIITVRMDEFKAVLKRLEAKRTVRGGKQSYDFCNVPVTGGEQVGVAIMRCLEQGPQKAQAVARDMIDDLDPRWLLLVGISGGLPSEDFSLGDVLLASRLHDFNVSAALEGKPPQYDVAGGPMHKEVQKLLSHLPAHDDALQGWNSRESIGLDKPAVQVPPCADAPELYGNRRWKQKVVASLRRNFPETSAPREPEYHIAATASSPTLVKSAKLASRWREVARQTANVEMELAGVYLAAHHGGTGDYPILAIRGISDVVGFERSPEWTEYACHSAASFANALIRSGVVEVSERAPSAGTPKSATTVEPGGQVPMSLSPVEFTFTNLDVQSLTNALRFHSPDPNTDEFVADGGIDQELIAEGGRIVCDAQSGIIRLEELLLPVERASSGKRLMSGRAHVYLATMSYNCKVVSGALNVEFEFGESKRIMRLRPSKRVDSGVAANILSETAKKVAHLQGFRRFEGVGSNLGQ